MTFYQFIYVSRLLLINTESSA